MLRYWLFVTAEFLTACSHPQATGSRVYLAKGNISLILPDSSLIYSKLFLWGADYHLGSYGEAGAFYHNADSSVRISVYVKAFPDPLQSTVPWHIIADEKRQRQELSARNWGLATIEAYRADSVSRTIEMDYHLAKQQEKGWRGQVSYSKSFTIYGPNRTIDIQLTGPDNALIRQQFAALQASVHVNASYLRAAAKLYPEREYQE